LSRKNNKSSPQTVVSYQNQISPDVLWLIVPPVEDIKSKREIGNPKIEVLALAAST
jgi:hypothetical protein